MHTKFKFTTPNSNCSHRIQIHHTKFKFLTPNSNSSHRIQIHHTEFKFATPNSNSPHQIQIPHTEFKFLTANSNSPHQIQIRHTKFKNLPHYFKEFYRTLILCVQKRIFNCDRLHCCACFASWLNATSSHDTLFALCSAQDAVLLTLWGTARKRRCQILLCLWQWYVLCL